MNNERQVMGLSNNIEFSTKDEQKAPAINQALFLSFFLLVVIYMIISYFGFHSVSYKIQRFIGETFRLPGSSSPTFFEKHLPIYVKARSTGRLCLCCSNLKNLATALQMYADDNEGFYPPRLEMITPNYMTHLPACKAYEAKYDIITRKRPGYDETYWVNSNFTIYSCYCGSRDHKPDYVPDNYPQYSSIRGLTIKP